MQDWISKDDVVGNFKIAVGKLTLDHVPSGSSTVIVVDVTAMTEVKGPMMLGPMKSPIKRREVGFVEQVITLVVELYAVALIPIVLGMAPTHWATRLTRALAD
jgi:hypothetical protein